MQTRELNSYQISHENGSIENINAETLVQALENMEVSEEYSPVIQTYLKEKGVRTLVADVPAEVIFSATVAENGGGSIATPSSGKIHVGDQLAFKAIPARNYVFVSWSLNGNVISKEADMLFTMPDLPAGMTSAVFTATFALAPLAWVTAVNPPEATGDGAVAFPASGNTPIGDDVSAIAVNSENYTFDHWERNGVSVGTNKILDVEATSLAEGETSCIFTAVFTAN